MDEKPWLPQCELSLRHFNQISRVTETNLRFSEAHVRKLGFKLAEMLSRGRVDDDRLIVPGSLHLADSVAESFQAMTSLRSSKVHEQFGILGISHVASLGTNWTTQRFFQRTRFSNRISTTIARQQLFGSLGQQSPNLSPLAFDPCDLHRIVGRCLVPHPGNDSGLGSLLNGNAFGSRHRPTTDRRGVIGHRSCQTVGKLGVVWMEGQKSDHCPQEVLDVFGLDLFTSLSSRLFPFGKLFCRSLCVEFSPNSINGDSRCPHSFGKGFAALLFLHDPMIASSFHTTSECGVSGWEQNPTLRCRQNFSIG